MSGTVDPGGDGCQARYFAPIGEAAAPTSLTPTAPLKFSFGGTPRRCGATYFVAVRATNCAGIARVVASAGATLCCEPPATGALIVYDPDGEPTAGFGGAAVPEVRATWSGFADACSGIQRYELSLSGRSAADPTASLELWRVELVNTSLAKYAIPIASLVDLALVVDTLTVSLVNTCLLFRPPPLRVSVVRGDISRLETCGKCAAAARLIRLRSMRRARAE